MKILVTGAAGFIGSHLSEHLISLGHQVCGIDCISDYYTKELKMLNLEHLKENDIKVFSLDLAKDDLDSVVQDIDFVYHLAAQPGISSTTDFNTYARNNIHATYQLLEAVQKTSNLKGFINIATSSVYGKDATGNEDTVPVPTSYYGVTKLSAEQLVLSLHRDKGFPACSMRLFSVYGPRERPEKLYPRLIDCILKDREFPLYEGSESHLRSYTFVGDIVEGLAAVISNFDHCQGEIFNLGTDIAITTGEGIQIVEEIIGKAAKKVIKPKRSGDQLRTHAHIEKARRILNYDPKTKAEEGLKKEVEWYKQYINQKINLYSNEQ